MKTVHITTRSVVFDTFAVEVEDDFDVTDLNAAEQIGGFYEYPEIASETNDWEVVAIREVVQR